MPRSYAFHRDMLTLKQPNHLLPDDRIIEPDKKLIEQLNASLDRLNALRAVEINVSEHFARSKLAWKLVTYQHVLLHRIVALVDGVALAWNHRCTLPAMLAARAFMETFAVMAELEDSVGRLLAQQDLGSLDTLAQCGIFASRDPEWIKEYPQLAAINVLTYIDKFDKRASGFRGLYDILSERCHPNSLSHNFMFGELNRSDGSLRFHDERDPAGNAQMVLAALAPLPLVDSMMARLDETILEVADLQHRLEPVGDA